jgi:hypothetical protein
MSTSKYLRCRLTGKLLVQRGSLTLFEKFRDNRFIDSTPRRQLLLLPLATALRCMLVEFMDIKTRSMPSLAINTSSGATLKAFRVFSKIYEEMATDAGKGADDFIFGNTAA